MTSAAVRVELAVGTPVTWAAEQAGVPIVRSARLTNTAGVSLQGGELVLQLMPDLGEALSVPFGVVGAGESFEFGPVDLRLPPGRLRSVLEAEWVTLDWKVVADGKVLGEDRVPLELLAYNEWPGMRAPASLIASFVTPNHPVIPGVLKRVSQRLLELTGDSALAGYQTKSPKRVVEMVQALYETLQILGITYLTVPSSFEKTGQKVRLPEVLLRELMGNCIDVSVLISACLEQMGLHPLLVIVEGHAFPGVWLIDDGFPEGEVYDAARLRNGRALDQLLFLDSSALTVQPRLPLTRAVAVAEAALENDARFGFAIDVRVARRNGYRPLPLRVDGPLTSPVSAEDKPAGDGSLAARLLDEATLQGPSRTRSEPPPPEPLVRRFAQWRDRLLDLSLRNKLLNFRLESKGVLPLTVPDLGRFEDLLAADRVFRLLPRPLVDARDDRDAALMAAHADPEQVHQEILADLERGLVRVPLQQEELRAHGLVLERAARLDIEEGGANTLYLALGMLKWFESTSSTQPRHAPLILVPVSVSLDRARQATVLKRLPEDSLSNVTLIEYLHREFDVDLSAFALLEPDESGVDVAGALRAVREAIQGQPRWEVREEAHLGLFSFTKFLMWRDLGENAATLLKNPVVAHIARGEHADFPNPVRAAEPRELDDTVPPEQLAIVHDADSTQIAAVVSALRGRSFVLQGPPGTGKSQTITNLIAVAMTQGKTVLFVSEKMAALEVVQRRLNQAGLGDFCLELHSHKANKKEVLDALGRSLARVRTGTAPPWTSRSAELGGLVAQLNEPVRALHAERPLGQSFYRASGTLLRLIAAQVPDITIAPPDPAGLTEDALRSALEAAGLFAAAAGEVSPVGANPWVGCALSDWSEKTERALRVSLDQGLAALSDVQSAAATLATTLGMPVPRSWAEHEDLADLGTAVTSGPFPACIAEEKAWNELAARGGEWNAAETLRQGQDADLSTRWQDGLFQLDLAPLAARFERWAKAFILLAAVMLWPARRRLRPLARKALPANGQIAGDLALARQTRDARTPLERQRGALEHDFEASWDGQDTESLRALVDRGNAARRILRRAQQSGQPSLARALALVDATVPADRRRAAGSEVEALRRALLRFNQLRSELEQALQPPATVWPAFGVPGAIDGLRQQLERWRQGMPQLRSWCAYRRQVLQLEGLHLAPIARAFESGELQSTDAVRATERGLLGAWVASVRDAEPALRRFDGATQHEIVRRFQVQDTAHVQLGRKQAAWVLESRLPGSIDAAPESSEPGILRRELRKKRGHLPIRKLIGQLPNLLPRLKPCVMMSPLSVAQFLPADGRRFDIVVFDEASQICTHDAIGAIGRGNQVVVVGDSKQLPPTSFFQRSFSDDSVPDDNDIVEMESILDEALGSGLPEQSLGWHYRSRHEALIRFSNEHFYGNDLSVFPAARGAVPDLGVKWHPVPQGVYEKGGARINRAEAKALVQQLVAELRGSEPGARTFGVVTFSQAQQNHVEDLLEEARQDPLVERHFAKDLLEAVFVKNLENVQGDERDVIFFSIGYGPDEQGRLWMNFGPLNRSGGERRLNVAVTRARELLRVYSTLTHSQIDLARTQGKGPRLLKGFLRYAEEQAAVEERLSRPTGGDFDSDFEREVYDSLVTRGHRVECQVGCGRYRIDLAVLHPTQPGVYLLGIECDGAAYHSGATARDRDRLRQQVLEGLGWKLHRIWSTDWWFDREREMTRLERAIENALKTPEPPRRSVVAPLVAPDPEPVAEKPIAVGFVPPAYRYAEISAVTPVKDSIHEARYTAELRKCVRLVVSVEAPVLLDDLARRILPAFGSLALTDRARSRVRSEVLALAPYTRLESDVIWRQDQDPGQWNEFRGPAASGQPRALESVPVEEIAAAVRHVLDASLSLPQADLVRETARLFGIQRTGKNVNDRVAVAIEWVERRNGLSREGERVSRK